MNESLKKLTSVENFNREVVDIFIPAVQSQFDLNIYKINETNKMGMSTQGRSLVEHFDEEVSEFKDALAAYESDPTNDAKLLHLIEECGDVVNVLVQNVFPHGIDIKTILAVNNVKVDSTFKTNN